MVVASGAECVNVSGLTCLPTSVDTMWENVNYFENNCTITV